MMTHRKWSKGAELSEKFFTPHFSTAPALSKVKLEGQRSVTALWFTTQCLPKVFENVSKNGLLLHFDNASSHTSNLTSQFLAESNIKTIPHPPYSPDLEMCDFWLFAGLKRYLRGRSFRTEQELNAAVLEYFDTIPESGWRGAFDTWKSRMERCIEVGWDYFENL